MTHYAPQLLKVLGCAVVLAGITTGASTRCLADQRPNILFIMSDDHAAHAIGAYGGRLAGLDPTPTLDRLAAGGVRFANCFNSNSICVPSRATLMTGQYSHRNGVRTLQGELPASRQALAHAMNAAGYDTAIVGKWHLGSEPAAFDHYCVLRGQGKYFNPTFHVRGTRPWPQNTVRPSDRTYDSIHSSDAITNESIAWLRSRPSDKPFFLMHHFKAPHDNFENAERYDWMYADDDIPEPASLRERGKHGPVGRPRYGTSVSRRNSRRNMGHHMTTPVDLEDNSYVGETYQRYLKKYLRCVRGVDDNIARLLRCLDELGLRDNTIVVYTSDQGFMLGEHDYIDKRWVYEESMRMPLIVAGPGVSAGEVRSELVTNVDFLPTLVELTGGEPVAEAQGLSLATLLGDEPPTDWRGAVYYRYWMHMTHHDVPAHYGIRTDRYKLIYFYGLPLDAEGALPTPTTPHWELYDLTIDPKEERNLIADGEYASVVATLTRRLDELKSDVGDTDAQYPELLSRRGQ